MDSDTVVSFARDAVQLALLLGAPTLLTGILVGILVGVLQTVVQVQDQTVAFVIKLTAMVGAFALFLPWMVTIIVDYSKDLFENIPESVAIFLQ